MDVRPYVEKATADNLPGIAGGFDVIVDCTDNFTARFLINDVAMTLGKPAVLASVYQYEGQLQVVEPGTACLRCLWPDGTRDGTVGNCAEAGVLGVLPGIVGSIQALEVIKVLLGIGEPLIGRILSVDTTDMSFRVFKLRPDPANEVTYANRDRIIVQELDGLCAPGLAH